MAGRKGTNVANITAEEVEKLSNFGATMPDMAAWFRCSLSWIEQKLAKNPELAAAREYGLGNLRCSLRQRQVKIAMDDHHPKQGLMLIWLGKQLLGQRDRMEVAGEDGGDIKLGLSVIDQLRKAAKK